jgi:NADH-quinone oxidoreductase subunit H
MRLGWKVLLPAALGWFVVLAGVKAVDAFTTYHFNEWFVPMLSGIVVLFVIMWYWPQAAPEADGADAAPEPFDPFAGGFPVPPLPGQVLPAPLAVGAGIVDVPPGATDNAGPELGAEDPGQLAAAEPAGTGQSNEEGEAR